MINTKSTLTIQQVFKTKGNMMNMKYMKSAGTTCLQVFKTEDCFDGSLQEISTHMLT